MPRIAFIDTYYGEFLQSLTIDTDSTYQEQLDKVLALSFGTFDAFSRNFRKLGWEAIDIIANFETLQRMAGHTGGLKGMALGQIKAFDPDVVFLQDVSFFDAETLAYLKSKYVLAAQVSCPMPSAKNVCQLDVVTTSFPHYVEQFENLGVKALFVPLAFDPIITIQRTNGSERREIDVAFVGGVGTPSHWSYGMEVLETVAREIPSAFFWGYGYDKLPSSSPLLPKYRGPAWGVHMYEIFRNSKIVLNRHGEVARDYANNLRLFESTGCGAMLLTDAKSNMRDYFSDKECVTYDSPKDAVKKIRFYLENQDKLRDIAIAGQDKTMRCHTYSKRMQTVSDYLLEAIAA